ncbi:polysaccharide biosynthesis/export family protein [Sphingomonas sp. 2378]|uniref:polysaccharide biosynthesis/export family protein n=1 Tax=Sphingomonas sp. 2378 TaxID=1219748 RepID=UPI00311ABE87
MRKSLTLVASVAVLATGCVSRTPLRSSSTLKVLDSQTMMPAPTRGDLIAPDRQSLIGPLDNISVDVFGIPEFTRDVQVDGSGRIAMPLIGTLDAGGKTAQELSSSIASALARAGVKRPDVTVNIKDSVSQVVTVDGQVAAPGLYPVTNQMTLLRAIASAKGLSEFAKQDDVVILRTVGNQRIAGLYNLDAIRRGNYADPQIYANDVVIVGDSPQRRLFRDFVSLAPLLAAPLIAIVQ